MEGKHALGEQTDCRRIVANKTTWGVGLWDQARFLATSSNTTPSVSQFFPPSRKRATPHHPSDHLTSREALQ